MTAPLRRIAAVLLSVPWSVAALAGESAVAQPRIDYMLNCQGCHLPDGSGYPGKVPDLRQTLAPLLGVAGGREFVLRVPGVATSPLDDSRLAALLNWMVGEFAASTPADLAPFAAAEIAGLRRHPLSDVQTPRAALAVAAGIPAQY